MVIARDPAVQSGWESGQRPPASDLMLPDVFRLVDEFDATSDAGHGTTIPATK